MAKSAQWPDKPGDDFLQTVGAIALLQGEFEALIELGKFLSVNDPLSGWSAVSIALSKIVGKKHQDRTKFERDNFQFSEQVQGTVASLKNAWRNKISHAQGKLVVLTADFGPEVAEEILFATRAFMRRLADGLPA